MEIVLTYKYYLHCSLSSKSDLCLRSYLKVKWCVAAGHKARQEEKDSCLEKNSHRFLKKCTYVGHFTVVLQWKNGSLKFFFAKNIDFFGYRKEISDSSKSDYQWFANNPNQYKWPLHSGLSIYLCTYWNWKFSSKLSFSASVLTKIQRY